MLPSSLFAVAGGKPFVRILSKSDGGLSGERSQDVDVIYVASDFLVDDEIYNSIRLLFFGRSGHPRDNSPGEGVQRSNTHQPGEPL